MRAMRLHALNGPLQLDNVDQPTAAQGETLVHVRYVSVNPIDIWATQGKAGPAPSLPFVPGVEGVGEAGGQLVLVNGSGLGTLRDGVFQEYLAVPSSAVIPLPHGVDAQQAAAMGVAGTTAWRVVHDFAHVTEGDRVLVLGASGGVGSLVVQVARNAGAQVWAQTSKAEKAPAVQQLGVVDVIVAGPDQLMDAAKDVRPTVVVDPLGDGFTAAAVELLQPLGRLVIFGTSAGESGQINLRALYRKVVSVLGYGGLTMTDQQRHQQVAQVVEELMAGRMKVPVQEVLPLEQANEAFRRILHHESTGKLLLSI